jgi:hypothetical protein
MNTTPTTEVVLKQDVLGRVKTPKARREQLLDEFERSGLTGQKFGEVVGIKYQTFATWAQKRRRQRGAYPAVKTPKQLRWLEAVVGELPDPGGKNPLVVKCRSAVVRSAVFVPSWGRKSG